MSFTPTAGVPMSTRHALGAPIIMMLSGGCCIAGAAWTARQLQMDPPLQSGPNDVPVYCALFVVDRPFGRAATLSSRFSSPFKNSTAPTYLMAAGS